MGDLASARRELEAALGPDRVLADPLALRVYARDASMVEGSAGLVVFPGSTEDVVACVRAAARHGLAVVPRGAGTGLAGGATPIDDPLVVVTSRMTRILEVRTDDRLAWVEPGLANLELSRALAPLGFTFAPDPSSQQTSSIGGNVNTNAGGPHCLAYGATAAHVLALDVVLADGSVERLGAEGPEAPGYDLRGLVVGSEGTLGIVTAACVRIQPVPPEVRTMLLDFTSVEDAAACVSEVIARGVVPAAVEMMDRGIVIAVERFAHAGYPTDAAAVLLVEVEGLPSTVAAQTREVEEAARAHGVRGVRVAADDRERELLWKGRRSAFGAVAQIAPHYHLHDCVVPRTRLAEVLLGVYAIAKRYGLTVTNVFHAGDGNLHPLFSFDLSVPGTLERVLAAADEVVRLCVDAGGTISGEHAIGLEKRDFMPLVFSPEDLTAQACVRAAFDPEGRMNPAEGAPRRGPLRGVRRGPRARRGARGLGAPRRRVDLRWSRSATPHTAGDVADILRTASAAARPVLVVGGRQHLDRGNPVEVATEVWTTQLDGVVAYDPAEMVASVAAGTRVGELRATLAAGGQEWPVDAPDAATVGGGDRRRRLVTAATARRPGARHGAAGRARHRGRADRAGGGRRPSSSPPATGSRGAMVGSLGTLGVLTQVAVKVRPLPSAVRTLRVEGDGLELGPRLLAATVTPAAVVAEPGAAEIRLEGWPEEIEEQTARARAVAPVEVVGDETPAEPVPFDPSPPVPHLVEAAVVPSRLADLLVGRTGWRALVGVGIAWIPVDDADDLARVRARVRELGGIAPVIRGPGGLGDADPPAAAVQRRLKAAFDPAGILAPGRGWGV
ncbi:MAG: hypothetical protein KatS3mg013_1851 [Actinomycetota bacterium]|nr:MAG: hypothetical protein KatS3mg013_1851 [Actinomycetota bacterium]